jgi:Fic family protein
VDALMTCLNDWEHFLYEDASGLPVLIKAGLAHVQFETIHPFLDGNGRMGRLFIPLWLTEQGLLSQPVLYLSLYFKTHRQTYYQLLTEVRETGNWEAWMQFFLENVYETANNAYESAQKLLAIVEEDKERIKTLGKSAPTARQLLDVLQQLPWITPAKAAERLDVAINTANKAIANLSALGIV